MINKIKTDKIAIITYLNLNTFFLNFTIENRNIPKLKVINPSLRIPDDHKTNEGVIMTTKKSNLLLEGIVKSL